MTPPARRTGPRARAALLVVVTCAVVGVGAFVGRRPLAVPGRLSPSASASEPRSAPLAPVVQVAPARAKRGAATTVVIPEQPVTLRQATTPAELEPCWAGEASDPEWSEMVRGFLYAFLEDEELESDFVADVDCHQTLCRIEFVGQGNEALLSRLHERISAAEYSFHIFLDAHDAGDGGVNPVVFLPRAGVDHPAFSGASRPAPRGL